MLQALVMADWGQWEDGHLPHGHWFSHHFRLGGKEDWVPLPKWLSNNFGNKEFDKARGSEAELVLREKKKRAGDRLSTRRATETPDKSLRRQGGRNSMPTTDHHGIGRCWEMQPEVQLSDTPLAPSG